MADVFQSLAFFVTGFAVAWIMARHRSERLLRIKDATIQLLNTQIADHRERYRLARHQEVLK